MAYSASCASTRTTFSRRFAHGPSNGPTSRVSARRPAYGCTSARIQRSALEMTMTMAPFRTQYASEGARQNAVPAFSAWGKYSTIYQLQWDFCRWSSPLGVARTSVLLVVRKTSRSLRTSRGKRLSGRQGWYTTTHMSHSWSIRPPPPWPNGSFVSCSRGCAPLRHQITAFDIVSRITILTPWLYFLFPISLPATFSAQEYLPLTLRGTSICLRQYGEGGEVGSASRKMISRLSIRVTAVNAQAEQASKAQQ